jgi:hypothetical protein
MFGWHKHAETLSNEGSGYNGYHPPDEANRLLSNHEEGNDMNRMIFACIAALTFAVSAAPASAQVSFSSSPSAGASSSGVTFDFDTTTPAFTGGGQVVTGSATPYAQPVGSTGSYFAVGPNNGGTASSLFFGNTAALSSVSWIWGSLDNYNSIQFFGEGGALSGGLITGDMISAPAAANGDQGSALTNRLVTFNFEGASQLVRGVNLVSTVDALEIDNITLTAAVPEPATWAMMIVGVGLVGGTMRRRQRTLVAA